MTATAPPIRTNTEDPDFLAGAAVLTGIDWACGTAEAGLGAAGAAAFGGGVNAAGCGIAALRQGRQRGTRIRAGERRDAVAHKVGIMAVRIAFLAGFEICLVACVLHGGPKGRRQHVIARVALRRRGRGLFGGAPDVAHEFLPARISPVSLPADKIGRLCLFEHDGPVDILHHCGNQHRGALAQFRLGADPFRFYRHRRPEHTTTSASRSMPSVTSS